MKHLWAPWRVEYVEGIGSADDKNKCIFCSAPEELKDDKGLALYAGPMTVVILNKFPYNNAHLLVAPRRHIADIENLTVEESADLFGLIKTSIAAVRSVYSPDGFNVGFNLGRGAGAGIPDHLHCHVVPRWNGDTNFMPVLSDTKVLPEHLSAAKKKLAPFFDKSK